LTGPPLRRVLLVGFMGAGKTSVGRRVAVALDWRFVDFDDAVEARAGKSIAAIFAEEGEEHFRILEERVARDLLDEEGVVLGSGGGWSARSGRLEELPEGTATVWLRVSAKEALKRTASQPGQRPLLAEPEPLKRAEGLLAERVPYYGRAGWTVDTERSTVEDVSARVLEILAREFPEIGCE
jgi:shikimate kinase